MTTKIALITGANKGIGFETARQLGRPRHDRAGRRAGRGSRPQAERALRDGGADARFVQLDVTDAKSVQQAAEWIDAEYGRLDVLVNNAGTARGAGRAAEPDALDAMRAVYETNVFGVVAVTNAMLPLLRRAPAARIVNVSSEVGSITSMTDPASPLAQCRPRCLPVVQDRAGHDHRDVRQGTAGHPDQGQRRQPRLLRHRPQRPPRLPHPRSRAPRSACTWPRCTTRPTGMLWGHLWATDGTRRLRPPALVRHSLWVV